MLVGPEEAATMNGTVLAEHITQFSLAALGFEAPLNQ
jgi:hypothetical protein